MRALAAIVLGTPRATTALCPCRSGRVHSNADRLGIQVPNGAPLSLSWGRFFDRIGPTQHCGDSRTSHHSRSPTRTQEGSKVGWVLGTGRVVVPRSQPAVAAEPGPGLPWAVLSSSPCFSPGGYRIPITRHPQTPNRHNLIHPSRHTNRPQIQTNHTHHYYHLTTHQYTKHSSRTHYHRYSRTDSTTHTIPIPARPNDAT